MFKKALLILALVGGFALIGSTEANAYGWRRGVVYHPVVAPVRRVAYRAVLPPYPVVRRAVVARPYVRAYTAYPVIYGPGVSVHIGY